MELFLLFIIAIGVVIWLCTKSAQVGAQIGAGLQAETVRKERAEAGDLGVLTETERILVFDNIERLLIQHGWKADGSQVAASVAI